MTADHDKPMPWEEEASELTEAQVKEQLARMLATGALQAARKSGGRAESEGGDRQS